MSTPDEQERVRRLLGDLAHSEQGDPPAMPPEGAARLDAALAAAAGPAPAQATEPAPEHATVVPLRRRVAPWLAAAAAVVVVGGLGTAALTSGDDGDTAAGGASSSAATESAEDSTPERSGADEESPAPAASPGDGDVGGLEDPRGSGDVRLVEMPALSVRSLADDTARLLAEGEIAGGDDATTDAVERDRLQGSGCVVPDPARGAATFVALDGDPAVLLVGPTDGAERTVTALACADGSTVAQAQVPTDAAGR